MEKVCEIKGFLNGRILDRDKIKKQILDILKKKNAMHQNELARFIGISPNSLKKIANELITSNLIDKICTKKHITYTVKNNFSYIGTEHHGISK